VSLLTDGEIREAIDAGDVALEPLGEDSIQPASYDLRLGTRALITKTLEIDKLRERVEQDEASETNVEEAGSISVPAGAFALVVTRESVRFGAQYAGHLGLRSYFARKGLLLLSGLQVDPGFQGYLVLGLANLSPRSVHIDFEEAIATLEIHRLNRPAVEPYSGAYAGQQTEAAIPRADADYLRTIETLSVSDLTRALLRLSDNVSTLSSDVSQLARYVKVVWIPVAVGVIVAILAAVLK
jgi:dCTP deaminase